MQRWRLLLHKRLYCYKTLVIFTVLKKNNTILPSYKLLYIPIALLLLLSFTDCAKQGSPSGGLKDSIPPVIVKTVPENYATNFEGNQIKIYFDEFIKLKELNKNLLISPPFDIQPTITPTSTSKLLKIVLNDTLQPNTTYAINFGKSIEDNNEANTFEYYKYVFSTGAFIDSLQLKGTIKDALLPELETPITIGLYEITETITDSVIYNEKPRYITTVRDSSNTFTIENIKEGTYKLVAFQEKSANYTYQPSTDKVAFYDKNISIPTDSSYALTLFKEVPDFKMARPKQIGQRHILFGYEGKTDSIPLEWISEKPEGFISAQYRDIKKDTIHYWFQPETTQDSLLFITPKASSVDTLLVKMKELYKDSLTITPAQKGVITLKDTFLLDINTPIVSVDESKVQVTDKDTLSITSRVELLKKYNRVAVLFNKKEEQQYTIKLLPGALTDFFEKQNDSVRYTISTKLTSDYGTIALTIENRNDQHLIVEITDTKYQVINSAYLAKEDENRVSFEFLTPGNYFIRVVKDANKNKSWDTGNYLLKQFPEEIVYYPTKLEVKANWYLEETFILE